MRVKTRKVIVIVSIVIGVLLLGVFAGEILLSPAKMKDGDTKIGVITTSVSDHSSDLVTYDENLKVQRVKSLDKYVGIGVLGEIETTRNRNYFIGVSGKMGVGNIDEFISIDIEDESISEYPVSNGFRVSGVTANSKYVYSYANLNGVSILTQYRQSDKKEVKIIENSALFEFVAATDKYIFVGSTMELRVVKPGYCVIYVFDAESLDLVRTIDLTAYGMTSADYHLLTEDSLYIPMFYKPEKITKEEVDESEDTRERNLSEEEVRKNIEESHLKEMEKQLQTFNNLVVKLSLEDFSVSVIELTRKTPTRIEKRRDTLFVLHENLVEETAYLTVYNEKTGKQFSYTLEGLFNITFALSESSLYMVAVDEKVGYYYIYRYDIAEDDTLTLVKSEMLEMDDSRGGRGVGGMFVYTKEEEN